MMNVRRSFLGVRSLSTRRPGRSTKGDAAYESHMQAATVRHRRNRTRTKETKLPETRTQPVRSSGRRERAAKGAIPTRTLDRQTHRTKRLGGSGSFSKSLRNVPESSAAKRSGKAPPQPPVETSSGTSTKSAPLIESGGKNSSSSIFSLLLLLGLASGSIGLTMGQSNEMQEKFPLFHKYIDDARQLVLPQADGKPKETNHDYSSDSSKKGWFSSLWRSDPKI